MRSRVLHGALILLLSLLPAVPVLCDACLPVECEDEVMASASEKGSEPVSRDHCGQAEKAEREALTAPTSGDPKAAFTDCCQGSASARPIDLRKNSSSATPTTASPVIAILERSAPTAVLGDARLSLSERPPNETGIPLYTRNSCLLL